jgi:hypothetical protein
MADFVALLTAAVQPAAKPSVQETAHAKLLADSARDAAKNPQQVENRRNDYADKLRTTAVKVQTALELQRSGATARAEALWSEAAKLMPVVVLFGRAAAAVVLEVVIKGFYVTLKGSVVDAEAFLDVARDKLEKGEPVAVNIADFWLEQYVRRGLRCDMRSGGGGGGGGRAGGYQRPSPYQHTGNGGRGQRGGSGMGNHRGGRYGGERGYSDRSYNPHGAPSSSSQMVNFSKPDCSDWKAGRCNRGAGCRYSHAGPGSASK